MHQKRECLRMTRVILGIVTWLILMSSLQTFCQDLNKLDSLELAYARGDVEDEQISPLLMLLSQFHESFNQRIIFSEELIKRGHEKDSLQLEFNGHLSRGHALSQIGEYNKALDDYNVATKIAGEFNRDKNLPVVYSAMAGLFSRMNNIETAIQYYKKSAPLFLKRDSLTYAVTLFNIGDQYLTLLKPDSALFYLDQSDPIFEARNVPLYSAYNLGNKGMAYALKGQDSKALQYMEQSISKLSDLGDYYPICQFLLGISDIYLNQENLEFAKQYALRSLELATEHQLKPEIRDANLALSKIYKAQGQPDEAFDHYQSYVQLKDSLVNISSVQQLADIRTDFEVSQKQLEVDLLNTEKRTQRIIMYALGFVLLLTAIYYRRIVKEKSRSDLLLLNILPTSTAKELKEKGKVEARKFESVTVMFTDFEAFTRYSQNLSPEKLVKSVDHYFSAFDKIIEKHGLEKIKTIGDSYMCTGGLISKGPMQPIKVIQAAFEILDFVQKEMESDKDEIAHFDIRIGINTGPVVAGVVGTKKFAYDIWGDTVNVAARMETNSQAGKINISENTYTYVKDRFECEYRGEIDVKNKGMMKMYFVKKLEVSSAPRTP